MDTKDLYICYDWSFNIEVISKSKKRYRAHRATALGTHYEAAKDMLIHDLKKKRWTLIAVRQARPTRVSFAFYKTEGHPYLEHERYSELPLPTVPLAL